MDSLRDGTSIQVKPLFKMLLQVKLIEEVYPPLMKDIECDQIVLLQLNPSIEIVKGFSIGIDSLSYFTKDIN